MINKKQTTLEILKNLDPFLSEKYGITKIGVFGSVARDEANEKSDIDIVYEIEKPNLFTAVHLKHELEKAFNSSVGLVRYRKTLNPYLKEKIESEGIYV